MAIPLDVLRTELATTDADALPRAIVDTPFQYRVEMVLMGIGITVFLLANKEDSQIYRVALSQTDMARGTTQISLKKFEDIVIPMNHTENIIAKAIETGEPQMTTDWKYLFTPALAPEQARLNQAGGGMACSFVYPFTFGKQAGALIFSYFKEPKDIPAEAKEFMAGYSHLVGDTLTNAGFDVEKACRR